MSKKNAPQPTWNLEALYASAAKWEEDFGRLAPLAEAFAAYRGRLGESPAVLRDAFAALDDFERLGEKVYTFAHLRSDENTADSENRARVDRVTGLFAELAGTLAWFEPEIMAVPEEAMARFLAAPELEFYRRSLEDLLRERAHTLSEPEERIIGLYSDVLGAPDKTFDMLNDADLSFGKVAAGKDGKLELTHGSYRRFLEHPDRKVRKAAFTKMLKTYRNFRHTFAATLDATVKRHAVSARLRNYPSALGAALFGDKVPEQVYTNLIDTVHAHLPALHQYLELRRKVLKLKKIDMYDLHTSLLPECRAEYGWEEAKRLALAALRPLGPEYLEIVRQSFEERWVDVPERKGKRSGAYSSGCYDSFPYLLLNFNGTLNDVFTLVHELGHSLHSYYSNRAQAYHYASYSIFVAEVASTANEILLFEHLLTQTRDKALRAYILCQLVDEIRSTIYRQTMFAEFELDIHRLAEERVPLTADLLDSRYYELNARYHGNRLKADPLIAAEWSRIPHFYYNFYVYKYATGMSAAIRLADGLLNGDRGNRDAYLNFLAAGDSKDVLEILADAGVDLSTPEPVAAALDYFGRTVDRLKKELAG